MSTVRLGDVRRAAPRVVPAADLIAVHVALVVSGMALVTAGALM